MCIAAKTVADKTALTPEQTKAILAAMMRLLAENENKLNSICGILTQSQKALETAADEVLLPEPEKRYETILSYSWEQFVEWATIADQLTMAKMHKHIAYTVFQDVYDQLRNSGVKVINDAMANVYDQYNKHFDPRFPLYRLIWNNQTLKPVFIASVLDVIASL
jgi:aspartokinase-like uncharacterized kinase